jgi:hypothetical protein
MMVSSMAGNGAIGLSLAKSFLGSRFSLTGGGLVNDDSYIHKIFPTKMAFLCGSGGSEGVDEGGDEGGY